MEPLTSAEYASVKEIDELMGDGPGALQLWPPVYTHRRALIATVEALEEVRADHDRLVRVLDVLMNGPEGSAAQASLCDLVGQFRKQLREHAGVFYSEPPPPDAVPILLPPRTREHGPGCNCDSCFNAYGGNPS